MLQKLTVQNFVIAEDLHIEFGSGLCVLTGETGAGKSLIVDSIMGVLGQRIGPDMIRQGSEYAYLELVFSMTPGVQAVLQTRDYVELLSEDCLVLSKTIYPTGSRSRLNGQLVSQALVRELATTLLDSIGQHENQVLFQQEQHLKLLDEYGPIEHQHLCQDLAKAYLALQETERELQVLEQDIVLHERQQDFLAYQHAEIEAAQLEVGEEESLQSERESLRHAEHLILSVSKVYSGLREEAKGSAICDQLEELQGLLTGASRYDNALTPITEKLEAALIYLQESARSLHHYLEEIDRDPHRLEQIEERLAQIQRLKRKYGEDIAAILAFAADLTQQLELLADSDQRMEQLRKQKIRLEEDYLSLAIRLRKARYKLARSLEPRIEQELKDLGMEKTRFEVSFEHQDKCAQRGLDRVCFMLSSNPGEPLRPLARIASGGEISRLLLAFKLVLKIKQPVPTLIFDEIDTGISGKTALVVSHKLARLAQDHQILCISHLPVIAAMADQQLWIEKKLGKQKTRVNVNVLSLEQRLARLAQMSSGKITDSGLEGAREIFAHAHAFKEDLSGILHCA